MKLAAVLACALCLFLGIWLGLGRPRVDRDAWPEGTEFQP